MNIYTLVPCACETLPAWNDTAASIVSSVDGNFGRNEILVNFCLNNISIHWNNVRGILNGVFLSADGITVSIRQRLVVPRYYDNDGQQP